MQKVPVATIPGAEEPDKFVLVHGHYDSWDVGVGDNATGDATLLELARVLWQHRGGLRRSVKLAWWPGHSTGRYAGSTWFTDAFALDLDRNCLAQINCDSPGCRWATSYHETRSFTRDVPASPPTRSATSCPTPSSRPVRPPQAGDYSFNNIGLPSFFMLSSTMPNSVARGEELLRRVGLRRQHRLAHRERHAGDRRPRHPAHRHEDLPAVGAARRERRGAAVRLGRRHATNSCRPSPPTRRPRKDWPILLAARDATETLKAALVQARCGTARAAERGAAGTRAHTGADQLHAGAALPPRSGLYGAAAADTGGRGRIAGIRRRPRPTLRHGRSDARTEPLRRGDGHGSAAGRIRCRVTASVQLRRFAAGCRDKTSPARRPTLI